MHPFSHKLYNPDSIVPMFHAFNPLGPLLSEVIVPTERRSQSRTQSAEQSSGDQGVSGDMIPEASTKI